MKRACLLALGFFCTWAFADAAQPMLKTRTWTGTNGKAIDAYFQAQRPGMIELGQVSGGYYCLPLQALSQTDQLWLRNTMQSYLVSQKQCRQAVFKRRYHAMGYEDIPKVLLKPGQILDLAGRSEVLVYARSVVEPGRMNRRNLVSFRPEKLQARYSACVVDAYASVIGWWHVANVVSLPDSFEYYEQKMEWVYNQLYKTLRVGDNSGTGVSLTPDSLQLFFQKALKTDAAFTYDFYYDYRPERLARHVKGANAAVLHLTLYHGKEKQGGYAVVVKSLERDGRIEFNAWGRSIQGKLVPTMDQSHQLEGLEQRLVNYELKVDDMGSLPESIRGQGVRLVLDAGEFDGLAVLVPYLKAGS
ncbi:hypothetical protein HW115_06985 [Verrucomicrobiaceae bacterium N1E253]|uniref:Uncharacterized protein n=1 Tax=Oceaniferula marina TaxID=2748318 RepID=A0A851GDW0_9BACT|nr:hypothetical protein [Oceaniferula marina]NWK55349.1 hypothetical protein [Oceaniferula marina]